MNEVSRCGENVEAGFSSRTGVTVDMLWCTYSFEYIVMGVVFNMYECGIGGNVVY